MYISNKCIAVCCTQRCPKRRMGAKICSSLKSFEVKVFQLLLMQASPSQIASPSQTAALSPAGWPLPAPAARQQFA